MTDSGHTFWYLTRSAGLVAYLLVYTSVVLGLLMTTDLLGKRLPRFKVYDIHRFLSLLVAGVTIFHVLIVLPDAFFSFSLAQLLIPFDSPYEPFYMALGAIALYLIGLIIASFYLLPRLSYRTWRVLHYATFAIFVLALVHGIGAGTDTSFGWVRYLYAVTGVSVFGLVVQRLLKGSARGLPSKAEAAEPALPTRSSV